MNRLFQTLMLAALALTTFVIAGSLAARFIGFRYEALNYIAWITPTGAGFLATKDNPLYLGIVAGAVVEFVRMTLGWVFASAAAVGPSIGAMAFNETIQTILLFTLLGAAWGLLGGSIRWMTSLIKHEQSNA